MLKGINLAKRPKLIHMQETSCDGEQWKSIEKHLKAVGFRAFHTMGTLDLKPSLGAWKRGIITAVSEGLKARFVEEVSWRNGQFHAVEVNGVLCINSYSSPGDENTHIHLSELESFMTRLQWEGLWLCGGDWNEEWSGSWTATIAGLHYGDIQDCSQVSSSRWDSTCMIDYWFSNFQIGKAEKRPEKLSDHCIIMTKVAFGTLLDETYTKFVQEKQFKCPAWLEASRWHKLFEEAYNLGAKCNGKKLLLWWKRWSGQTTLVSRTSSTMSGLWFALG